MSLVASTKGSKTHKQTPNHQQISTLQLSRFPPHSLSRTFCSHNILSQHDTASTMTPHLTWVSVWSSPFLTSDLMCKFTSNPRPSSGKLPAGAMLIHRARALVSFNYPQRLKMTETPVYSRAGAEVTSVWSALWDYLPRFSLNWRHLWTSPDFPLAFVT